MAAKKPVSKYPRKPTKAEERAYNPFACTDLFASETTINEHSALNVPAVLAAVRVLSESVAQLPLHVHRQDGEMTEKATDHPLYRLLHDEPNPFMTSFTLRETLMSHLLLWGNAYAWIERGTDTRPVAIWPLLPDRTKPEVNNGNLSYVSIIDNKPQRFMPTDIVHLVGLSSDGINGYSPIKLLRGALKIAKSAEDFGGRFFEANANMGGTLEHPGKLSPEATEKLKNSITSNYSGNANAFKIMVLAEGMKFNKFGIPPEDAQFLQTRTFQVKEIARAFKLPAYKIGDDARTSYASVEAEQLSYYKDSLQPYLVRWEQELNRKLFLTSEANTYVEFDTNGLLRGDTAARLASYQSGLLYGYYNVNEVRSWENLNPIEGGDIYRVQLNTTPLNETKAEGDTSGQGEKK